MFPNEPPEELNWKAIPFVVGVFAALAFVLFGGIHLAQTKGFLLAPTPEATTHIPLPTAALVGNGGAVFGQDEAHTPIAWKEGRHLLVVHGDVAWTAVFETGQACGATASYLTDPAIGLAKTASCHPKNT